MNSQSVCHRAIVNAISQKRNQPFVQQNEAFFRLAYLECLSKELEGRT
jgi:hypothetical protein